MIQHSKQDLQVPKIVELRIAYTMNYTSRQKKIYFILGSGDWFSSLGSLTGLMDWIGELGNKTFKLPSSELLPSPGASVSTGTCVEVGYTCI